MNNRCQNNDEKIEQRRIHDFTYIPTTMNNCVFIGNIYTLFINGVIDSLNKRMSKLNKDISISNNLCNPITKVFFISKKLKQQLSKIFISLISLAVNILKARRLDVPN